VSVERFESNAKKAVMNEISAYSGPRALLSGEDGDRYDRLLSSVTDTVKPTDIFEQFWISDIVYLQWDIERLRRLRAAHIDGTREEAFNALLCSFEYEIIASPRNEWTLARQYMRGDPAAISQIGKMMEERSISYDGVLAKAIALKGNELTRFDHMIALAETRRNKALREIQRHRETFGAELKRAVDAVDADFEVVANPGLKSIDQQEPPQQQKAA